MKLTEHDQILMNSFFYGKSECVTDFFRVIVAAGLLSPDAPESQWDDTTITLRKLGDIASQLMRENAVLVAKLKISAKDDVALKTVLIRLEMVLKHIVE